MNSKIKKLVEQAKKELSLKKDKKHRLLCFVLDPKYRVISKGYNSYTKTHSLQAKLALKYGNSKRLFLHCEIAALARIIRNKNIRPFRNISKILIIRFSKNGNLSLASPCEICREAIRLAGIRKIIYTTNHGIKEIFI